MTGDNWSGGATIARLNLASTCPCKRFLTGRIFPNAFGEGARHPFGRRVSGGADMRSERVQPDHLLAVAVGAAIGFLFGLGFAAVALGCRGSVRRRVVSGALGFSLAVVGAAVGAFALALAAGGAPIVRLLESR